MTSKTKTVLTSALVLCFCNTAAADPLKLPAGMAGTPNIGAIPCAVYSEMMRVGPKGTRLSLLTWAEGYIYAKTGKTLDEILEENADADDSYDFFGITDRFKEYCATNPEAITREAVVELGEELMAAGQ